MNQTIYRQEGTESYAAGTEWYAVDTEWYAVGTESYAAGTELYVAGTEWYVAGTESYAEGTECYAVGTESYVAGTESYAVCTVTLLCLGRSCGSHCNCIIPCFSQECLKCLILSVKQIHARSQGGCENVQTLELCPWQQQQGEKRTNPENN